MGGRFQVHHHYSLIIINRLFKTILMEYIRFVYNY